MKQTTPETAKALLEIKQAIAKNQKIDLLIDRLLSYQIVCMGDKFMLYESNGVSPAGYVLTVKDYDIETSTFMDEFGVSNQLSWGRVLQHGEKTDLYDLNRKAVEQQGIEVFSRVFEIVPTQVHNSDYYTAGEALSILESSFHASDVPFKSNIEIGMFLRKHAVSRKYRGQNQYLLLLNREALP